MIRLLFALATLLFGVFALSLPLIESSQTAIRRHWQASLSPAAYQMPPGVPPLGTAPYSAYPPGTMFPPGTLFPPQSYEEAARYNGGVVKPNIGERTHGQLGQTFPSAMFPPYTYLPGALFPSGTFPPDTKFNVFGGIAMPPDSVGSGQRLWNYAPPAFGVCVASLVFLLFCVTFNDRFFRGAALLTAAAFVGTTLFIALDISLNHHNWNSAVPVRFGFVFVLLSALCAAVAALRREELPALDEISDVWSEYRQQNAAQPVRSGLLTHRLTTPAARAVLISIATVSLLGACVLPVLRTHSFYGSRAIASVVSLFDYSPLLPLIMLAPLAAMIYGIKAERNDIRKIGAGAGTLLIFGQIALLWRDARDAANDYTYGLLAVPAHYPLDIPASGFWLLVLAGLCWFALNFDDPEFFSRAANPSNSGPKPRASLPATPMDFAGIAFQGLAALLTFGFCLSVFPLGIFLWRYFDEQDNRLAPAALCGWVLGLIFWLGRFLLVGVRAFST